MRRIGVPFINMNQWVQIFGYVLACRSYSFVCTVHHLIIIIVKALNLWNACQRYFVQCVSKIKHILSIIHYTKYGAVCFHSPISLVMIERIYILCLIIIIKSEVWTITHCLRSGHETMLSTVCLSIFLWIKMTLGDAWPTFPNLVFTNIVTNLTL